MLRHRADAGRASPTTPKGGFGFAASMHRRKPSATYSIFRIRRGCSAMERPASAGSGLNSTPPPPAFRCTAVGASNLASPERAPLFEFPDAKEHHVIDQ